MVVVASVDADRTLLQAPVATAIFNSDALRRSDKLRRVEVTVVDTAQQEVAGVDIAAGHIVLKSTVVEAIHTIVHLVVGVAVGSAVAPDDAVVDFETVTVIMDTRTRGVAVHQCVVHHGEVLPCLIAVVAIQTTTIIRSGIVGGQHVLQTHLVAGIDTAAMAGAVTGDNGIGNDGGIRGIVRRCPDTTTDIDRTAVGDDKSVEVHTAEH